MGGRMKQKKLLNKTLHHYLVYGLVIAMVVIPVFYVLMRWYIIHELDEFLMEERNITIEKSLQTLKISEISEWNRFNSKLDKHLLFVSKGTYSIDFTILLRVTLPARGVGDIGISFCPKTDNLNRKTNKNTKNLIIISCLI